MHQSSTLAHYHVLVDENGFDVDGCSCWPTGWATFTASVAGGRGGGGWVGGWDSVGRVKFSCRVRGLSAEMEVSLLGGYEYLCGQVERRRHV